MKGIYDKRHKPEVETGLLKMWSDELGNRVCFVRLHNCQGVGFGMTDFTAHINAYREAIRLNKRAR